MIESAIHKNFPIFSFDKARIISKKRKSQLKSRLPLRKLSKLSQRTHMDYMDGKGGYLSKIEIERPQQKWFTILDKYNDSEDKNRLGNYKISYLELAYDWEMPTDRMAVRESKYIAKSFKKSYRRSKEPIKTTECYNCNEGRPFFYAAIDTDNKKFIVVIYSRRSKVNGKPIVRIEWRLRSSAVIRSKTGIVYINDFNNFDNMDYFKKHFILETIDYEEFGKWLTPNQYKPKKYRKFVYKPRPGYEYCRAINISCSTDLRAYLKQRKYLLSKKRGRHTQFQKRIEQLTPYRKNKFFKEKEW